MKPTIHEGLSQAELMRPVSDFVIPLETVFPATFTIKQLLDSLQSQQIKHRTSYFYVSNEDARLCGVVATRSLLFNKPQTILAKIMVKDVIYVDQSSPLKDALKKMVEHELLALPVTDNQQHLIGVIELPSLPFSIPHEKENKSPKTRDVFQIIGLTVEQSHLTSSFKEFRYRMPWLLCNIFAGLTCAIIASFFHQLLDDEVVVAMFIPLVLTLGESVAMQSMTLSLPFLHYGRIPLKRVVRRIITEWKTAVLLGVACILLIALVYLSWYTGYKALWAISLSIFVSILIATTFGSIFPILLHLAKLDPQVASGPVVLMLTDVSVTTIYLYLAQRIL